MIFSDPAARPEASDQKYKISKIKVAYTSKKIQNKKAFSKNLKRFLQKNPKNPSLKQKSKKNLKMKKQN